MTRYTFVAVFSILLVGMYIYANTLAPPNAETDSHVVLLKRSDANEAVSVTPVLRFTEKSPIEVEVVFGNHSDQSITYVVGDDGGIGGLDFDLYENGKRVKGRGQNGERMVTRERVRELKPGMGVRHRFQVATWYPNLTAGRYELRVRYVNYSNEFGLTPMTIDRTVAHIEVGAR